MQRSIILLKDQLMLLAGVGEKFMVHTEIETATKLHCCTEYVGIGEEIHQQYMAAAESAKQKAIRCTEEVVRREEAERLEKTLAATEEEWKQEKKQLFKEAHQNQLKAIARQNAILEEKLRGEFANTLAHAQEEHRQQVKKAIKETWEEAEGVKDMAVLEVRADEQALARDEARKVAEQVAKEKKAAEVLASQKETRALDDQRRHMEVVHQQALEEQRQELERQFEGRLSDVRTQYQAKLDELQSRYEDQLANCQCLEGELQAMTDLKSEWEQKHANVKQEFSDFIDQFPGFRSEFLLN